MLSDDKGLMLAAFSVKTSKLSMVFDIFRICSLNILCLILHFGGGGGVVKETVMIVDKAQVPTGPWFCQSHCFPGPSQLQFVMDSYI